MADWLQMTVLYVAFVTAGFLVLWPTSHSGKRLLRTWGIPDPRPGQVDEAIRYLRRRRLLAVLLFVVSGLVAFAVSIICWLWVAVPSRRSLVTKG